MRESDKIVLDLESILKERELYENPGTQKQGDILRAAERLFSESGYAETSTASIAKEAGVTERTLFKHFPSKQDLLRRILFPLIVRSIVPFQIAMLKKFLDHEQGSFRDFFFALARNRWSEARAIGPRLKLVLVEVLQENRLRAQARKLFLDHAWPHVLEKIKHYQQTGELRSDISAEAITEVMVLVVMGKALQRGVIAPEAIYEDDADLESTFQLLFEGARRV